MIFGIGYFHKITPGQKKKENAYLSQEQKVILENTRERLKTSDYLATQGGNTPDQN